VKQAIFAYVNHAPIRSWNQPVLSNEGKVPCSRKEREPLMEFKLTTGMHSPITNQTRYPLRHAAPCIHYGYTLICDIYRIPISIDTSDGTLLYRLKYQSSTKISIYLYDIIIIYFTHYQAYVSGFNLFQKIDHVYNVHSDFLK